MNDAICVWYFSSVLFVSYICCSDYTRGEETHQWRYVYSYGFLSPLPALQLKTFSHPHYCYAEPPSSSTPSKSKHGKKSSKKSKSSKKRSSNKEQISPGKKRKLYSGVCFCCANLMIIIVCYKSDCSPSYLCFRGKRLVSKKTQEFKTWCEFVFSIISHLDSSEIESHTVISILCGLQCCKRYAYIVGMFA